MHEKCAATCKICKAESSMDDPTRFDVRPQAKNSEKETESSANDEL